MENTDMARMNLYSIGPQSDMTKLAMVMPTTIGEHGSVQGELQPQTHLT